MLKPELKSNMKIHIWTVNKFSMASIIWIRSASLFYFSFQLNQTHSLKCASSFHHSNTVQWSICWPINKGPDGVRIAWWSTVSELDAWGTISQMGAVLMEAADGPGQACIPPVTLWHRLCHSVYSLCVSEGLII